MHNSSCAHLSQQVNSGEAEGIHFSATQVNLPAKMCHPVIALTTAILEVQIIFTLFSLHTAQMKCRDAFADLSFCSTRQCY